MTCARADHDHGIPAVLPPGLLAVMRSVLGAVNAEDVIYLSTAPGMSGERSRTAFAVGCTIHRPSFERQ